MIFFADENVPVRAGELLEIFDPSNEIRALEHILAKGTPDTEWMPTIARWEPKPIVLGGDGRILRNPVERGVLRECELMFVFLSKGWTNLPWDDFAWKIIKAWPAIVANVGRAGAHPTIFEVSVGALKVQRKGFTRDLPRQ